MTTRSIQQAIDQYHSDGLSFFPIPARSKEATISWKIYQKRLPTEEEIAHWKCNGTANIAIVCGAVSGNLVVLDFDSHDRFLDYCTLLQDKYNIDLFSYTRIVTTARGNHVYFKLHNTIKSAKFPQIDVKSEGGYVMAPPSIHPSGSEYKCSNPNIPIRHIDSLKDVGIDVTQEQEKTISTNHPGWVSELLKGVAQGNRDDSAIRLIGYFRNLLPIDVTEMLILDWNTKNQPPLPDNVLLEKVKRIYSEKSPHVPMDKEYFFHNTVDEGQTESNHHKTVTENVTTLAKRIEEWVRNTNGWFDYTDIDRELNLDAKGKHNRLVILQRLKENGTIESHKTHNKLYRFVNAQIRLIDFKSAGNRAPLNIKFPFNIEGYCLTYPGNIIVIAGVPDAGKTAILLNFVRLNMYDFSIYYQSSEMGATEIASRLEKFEGISLSDWNFIAEERSTDFADVIRPDAINVIDYLELTENFYLVAGHLKAIHDKLKGGIGIIALQKAPNAPYSVGGYLSAALPRLYLTVDKTSDGQIIRMKKAKNWANPEVNPNRLSLNFKIYKGNKLITTRDWYEESQ